MLPSALRAQKTGKAVCKEKSLSIIKAAKGNQKKMSFTEELKAFQDTHPFSQIDMNGIGVTYLLCGNPNSKVTLIYLVGGTGLSVVWFNHLRQMEQDYRILTFDYPMEINDIEELADFVILLIKKLKIKPITEQEYQKAREHLSRGLFANCNTSLFGQL